MEAGAQAGHPAPTEIWAEWCSIRDAGPLDDLIERCFYDSWQSAPRRQIRAKSAGEVKFQTQIDPIRIADVLAWCELHSVAPELRPLVWRGVVACEEAKG